MCSPHWRVGFLFLVLYPRLLLPVLLLPVLLLHSLARSLTHSLTHALTHSLIDTHSLTGTHSSLTHWHTLITHSLTHALAFLGLRRSAGGFCVAGAALGALQGVGCTPWRPLVSGGFCVAGAALGALQGVGCTPWLPLVSAALPVAFAWQARHLVLCKGSDVRPVPWSPVAFAWQARHLVLCKGSDVRPGFPWSPLLCRWLLRGRRGTWCSARGRMYAPSLGLRWLLRGRRGTWCSARGRMYALASLGLRRSAGGFCVAGAALGALQGVGCTPWRSPVAFAWQARHLMLCKGSDVRPGVPWSPPLCRWLLRGRRGTWCSATRGRRGTWCSARGRMYALVSLGLRCSAGAFCVAGAALGALQGVGCTLWRPLVSGGFCVAGAASLGLRRSAGGFCVAGAVLGALQVAGAALGALQGVGFTPWRPLVSGGFCVAGATLPGALRGRRGTWCSARGWMYALASLGLRWLLRGRRGTWCSARGRMYALASLGLRRSAAGLCVAGAALGALQGVGCTPWRSLVSGGFCVAGAALGALQGVGCTPWRPLVSAALPVAFAWQARHLVLCKGSDLTFA